MKSIQELTRTLRLHPQEINSSIKHFADQTIDWDVYLPSKDMNLQRAFVWTIDQKREIIWSILMKRHIPRMAIICTANDVYEIIDGKQRLSAMIGFYDDEFTLKIDGEEYYFKDLPIDYQRVIGNYYFAYYVIHEISEQYTISDQDKIDWFKFINFAGTPQDAEHFKALS